MACTDCGEDNLDPDQGCLEGQDCHNNDADICDDTVEDPIGGLYEIIMTPPRPCGEEWEGPAITASGCVISGIRVLGVECDL